MATKEARGTKRTCQNPECGARFYDLNRDPIVCPICESVYKLTAAQIAEGEREDELNAASAAAAAAPAIVSDDDAGDGAEIEEDDALVSLEDAEEDVDTSDEDDDAFLPDDEDDDGDVSDILGSSVAGEDGEDET
jgi:uncharacterized protein (TIGR02300 family)